VVGATSRAQLWLRGDGQSSIGTSTVVVFDNMQDRPIHAGHWKHYEIVAKIPSTTEGLVLGVLTFGKGEVWIDDCSLTVVEDPKIKETASNLSQGAGGGSNSPVRPVEPVWIVACGFAIAACIALISVWAQLDGSLRGQRFALRFTWVYWVMYSQLAVLGAIPIVGWYVVGINTSTQDQVVRWFYKNVIGMTNELAGPNGSGDTTHDYLRVLLVFSVSLAIGLIWSGLVRKSTWDARLKDLLQSFLRYTLGFTLVGYGVAKFTTNYNQFPAPGMEQLLKTWGDSSPMNVLWTMMGSSPTYTFFAGLGEVIAGFLLVFRRTTLIGAALSAGIMFNIFMLNLCYDVPVKQYSWHLFIMAVQLMFADRRWLQIGLLNQTAQKRELGPSYSKPYFFPFHLVFKVLLIGLGVVLPMGTTLIQSLSVEPKPTTNPMLGAYRVESFKQVEPSVNGSKQMAEWQNVILREFPSFGPSKPGFTQMQIRTKDSQKETFRVKLQLETNTIAIENTESQFVFSNEDNFVRLTGTLKGKAIEAVLKRITRDDFLLVNRGFRWVNEAPYNR
jgi:uncharacterized membrane protein YphA (DoxX/SURF4 family)